MKEFKVGDVVKIRKSSTYYGESESNPCDTKGIVMSANSVLVEVKWANNTCNNYCHEDLKHVKPKLNEYFEFLH